MSINELFSPNDYVIYAGSTISGGETINGNLTVNGTVNQRSATFRTEIESGNLWGMYKADPPSRDFVLFPDGLAVGSDFQIQTGPGRTRMTNVNISGFLQDGTSSQGTANQYLRSTGTGIQWANVQSRTSMFLQSVNPVPTGSYIGNFGSDPILFKCAYYMNQNGILDDITFASDVAPGAGNIYSITLHINNVVTANIVTLSGSTSVSTVSFNAPFNAGDYLAFQFNRVGGADPIVNVSFGFYYT